MGVKRFLNDIEFTISFSSEKDNIVVKLFLNTIYMDFVKSMI